MKNSNLEESKYQLVLFTLIVIGVLIFDLIIFMIYKFL